MGCIFRLLFDIDPGLGPRVAAPEPEDAESGHFGPEATCIFNKHPSIDTSSFNYQL